MGASGGGGSLGNDRESWTLILRALGAIAAGIGALGFVTLAGGLVLFERFDGVGLPAEHAVAVVPRTDLLVVGASSLVPLAVLVGFAVFVLWLVLEGVEWGRQKVTQSPSDDPDAEPPKRTHTLGMWRVSVAAAASALGTIAYIFLSAGRHVSHTWHVILLGATVVGAAVLWPLGWKALSRLLEGGQLTRSGRFAWFSVLITALAFVVAGLVNWVETREVPLVRPAVLETTSHKVVKGLFIADGGDGIYLGEVSVPGNAAKPGVGISRTGLMLHFRRGQVLRLAVGTNQPLWSARSEWAHMESVLESTIR